MVSQKKVNVTLLLFAITIFLYATSFSIKKTEAKEYVPIPVFIGLLTPEEINEEVMANKEYYIFLFALEQNIRKDVTSIIIEEALKNEIPINLAFALARAESCYNVSAFNRSNANGSFDYGLFQLNSYTFPFCESSYNYKNNTKIALKFLKDLEKQYGSFDLALIHYNAGGIRKYNTRTANHLKRIWGYEKELNDWFNKKFRDKISRNTYQSEIYSTRE